MASPSWAAWPAPAGATAAQLADPANWPDDPDYSAAFWLWGFVPSTSAASIPARERAAGAGMRVDAAWSTTTGNPEVAIVVVGSGAQWSHPDLLARWKLSRGELPAPQAADGTTAQTDDPHDLNGDGRFDVRDFTQAAPRQLPAIDSVSDPRLTSRADRGDTNGNGLLEPQDLIRIFSDGVDDDQNGRTDDICGWDFTDGDNDPEDVNADSTSTRAAALAAAEADNAIAGVGVCPDCSVVPLRLAGNVDGASPSSVLEALTFASTAGDGRRRATLIALLTQPQVVTPTLVALTESLRAPDANAVLLSGGPLGHVPLGAVGPDVALTGQPTTFLHPSPGCAGSRLSEIQIAIAAPACGADAVAIAAGLAGLVASALPVDHEGGSLTAALAGTAANALSRIEGVPFEPATGRGRADAAALVSASAMGGPFVPPPFVDGGWNVRRPLEASLSLSGRVAPGVTAVEVLVARGSAPQQGAYRPANVTLETDGTFVATFDVADLPPPQTRRDPFEESALTLSLRATAGAQTAVSFGRVLLTGSSLLAPGYPLRVAAGISSPARLVDLDGDRSDELVFTSSDGRVYALTLRRAPVAGFPVDVPTGVHPTATLTMPPAAADLDGRGRRSLIVASREGALSVIAPDGAIVFTRDIEGGLSHSPAIATTPSGAVIVALGDDGRLHLLSPDGSPRGEPVQLPFVRARAPVAVADLSGDGIPDVVAVGDSAEGRTLAVVMELTASVPRLRRGWPVELSQTAGVRVEAPVIGDFASRRHRGIVLVVEGSSPRILDPDGQPLVTLAWPQGSEGKAVAPVASGLADVEQNRQLQLLAAHPGGIGMWNVGEQVLRNQRTTPSPALLRVGFPTTVAPSTGTGFAVGEIAGDGVTQILHGTNESVIAFGRDGEAIQGWPQFVGANILGPPTIGAQGGRVVVAAAASDGWLYLWHGVGVPTRIQWDGYAHDPEHTGFFGTPLPARDIGGIGEEVPPPPPPSGCCSGAPSGVELSALGLLLLALRLRRPASIVATRRGLR